MLCYSTVPGAPLLPSCRVLQQAAIGDFPHCTTVLLYALASAQRYESTVSPRIPHRPVQLQCQQQYSIVSACTAQPLTLGNICTGHARPPSTSQVGSSCFCSERMAGRPSCGCPSRLLIRPPQPAKALWRRRCDRQPELTGPQRLVVLLDPGWLRPRFAPTGGYRAQLQPTQYRAAANRQEDPRYERARITPLSPGARHLSPAAQYVRQGLSSIASRKPPRDFSSPALLWILSLPICQFNRAACCVPSHLFSRSRDPICRAYPPPLLLIPPCRGPTTRHLSSAAACAVGTPSSASPSV
jgi:hypothetical protein